MDRGGWRAAVHRVAQTRSRLMQLSTHAQEVTIYWRTHKQSGYSVISVIVKVQQLELFPCK